MSASSLRRPIGSVAASVGAKKVPTPVSARGSTIPAKSVNTVSAGSAKIAEKKRLAEEQAKKNAEEREEMIKKIAALEAERVQFQKRAEEHERKEIEHMRRSLALQQAELDIETKDRKIKELLEAAERSRVTLEKVSEQLAAAMRKKDEAEADANHWRAQATAMGVTIKATERAMDELKTEIQQTPMAARLPEVAATRQRRGSVSSLFIPVSMPTAVTPLPTHFTGSGAGAVSVLRATGGSSAPVSGTQEYFRKCMSPGLLSVYEQITKAISETGDALKNGLLEDYLAELLKVYVNVVDYPNLTITHLISQVKSANPKFAALDFKPSRDEDRLTYLKARFGSATDDGIAKTLCRTVASAYVSNFIPSPIAMSRQQEFDSLAKQLKSKVSERGVAPTVVPPQNVPGVR